MCLNKCMWFCNHHPVLKHSHYIKNFPGDSLHTILVPSNPLYVSIVLPFLEISYKWNHTIQSLLCLVSSLSMRFLRFIHVVAYIKFVSFYCWQYSMHGYNTFCLSVDIWVASSVGYYDSCGCEHSHTSLCVDRGFLHYSWIDNLDWNCWFMW